MAHCPDWYATIQAAKYLGVPPWELIRESIFWRDKALKAMGAEKGARKVLQEHGL